MFMQKKEPQIARVLTNQQLGPLVPRVSTPYIADLQRRLTGEMRRFHSDNDLRPMPNTDSTEASSHGQHIVQEFTMPRQEADFVAKLGKNVCVTARYQEVVALFTTDCDDPLLASETYKDEDIVGPVATTSILSMDICDDTVRIPTTDGYSNLRLVL